MKKRVTAELISIAHRILKLKSHSETVQLQQEAKNLYDQLTILRFYEENFELLKNEIPTEVLEAKLEKKKDDVFELPIAVANETTAPSPIVNDEEIAKEIDAPVEKTIVAALELDEEDEIKDNPTVIAVEEQPITSASEVVGTKAKQISFEDLLVHDYKDMDFVKVEDVPAEAEKAAETVFEAAASVNEESKLEPVVAEAPKIVEEVKTTLEKVNQEPKISSLNDRLNKAISFGLNDRIGFEKKLFGGSSDDFNRVVSQLNTFDNFEEAKAFVNDFVKPDYNNWEGAEEFEARFMEIVEKKFN